jgi:hypothetical protein
MKQQSNECPAFVNLFSVSGNLGELSNINKQESGFKVAKAEFSQYSR